MGGFSILYNYDKVRTIDFYKNHSYSVYLDGNKAMERIEGMDAPNDTRVLLLRDSNAGVVAPFLALAFRRLDTLDLCYFTGSVRSYIDQEKPDLVLVMYRPFFQGNTELNTHTAMFDFR